MKTLHKLNQIILFTVLLFGFLMIQAQDKPVEHRVYQYVVTNAQGGFDEISAALETRVTASGWQLLASVECGVPEDCSYRSQVLVVFDPDYARRIMEANRKTGPFGVMDRINLFEDENGIHVSVVNPLSVNRTILMDDMAYQKMSAEHLQALREMITGAVTGTVAEKEYGQKRKKGYISRTMGVMAGGKFEDKLQEIATVAEGDLQTIADKVQEGLSNTSEKWGMHQVFRLDLPEYQTVVFGTTGTPMDSKSFDIVKAGSDKPRKKFSCPGLAHAAAYPINVVVTREEDGVKVRLVDVMYRMKMYFEDAGKWAFMKNMGMPGSIQGELEDQIHSALGIE